jgi:hypothetical protein
MKRLAFSLVMMGAAVLVMAQAPFTIVRPADGAKVREDVRVLIPKNSVPKTGYVGFFLDGKFMEAVIPSLSGRYYQYLLDTKGKKIEDGKHTLEAVLYVDYSDEPRIVDRSSVTMNIQNHANIPIPAAGFAFRYNFKPGADLRYTVLQRIAKNQVSVNAAALGLEGTMPLDYEKIRMNYAIENTYDNGDSLVRLQAEPLKNKKYVMYTADGQTDPKLYFDTDMAPIYMKLTSSGFEVFGSVPQFIPFETIHSNGSPEFYANWPLPTLPSNRVKPGDVWPTRFQVGKRNIGSQTGANSVVNAFPARGEFRDLEWEMGHPCAKIINSITFGGKPQPGGGNSPRVSLEETVWYALDKNQVIKIVRDQTFDQTGQSQGPGPNNGGQNNGSPGRGLRKSAGNAPSDGGGGGGGLRKGGGGGGIDLATPQSATPLMQNGALRKRRPGSVGSNGGPGRNNVPGNSNGNPPSIPGGGASITRLAIEQIFILDQ